MFDVQPIGVVRSPLRAKAEAPNQAFEGAPAAVLEIEPAFADALHLIQPGDELVVLTWLRLADRSGVFRTRSLVARGRFRERVGIRLDDRMQYP